MQTHIEFTRAPIVPPAPAAAAREIGAVLEFSGIVRELENGTKIPGLRYEAYEPMARMQLEKICAELSAKHACEEIWFSHRLEFVPVGEASLFIRINASHRKPALALMAELIDRLKTDVPVWKISDVLH
jgi:molybdopterin synthase catalytic subunit